MCICMGVLVSGCTSVNEFIGVRECTDAWIHGYMGVWVPHLTVLRGLVVAVSDGTDVMRPPRQPRQLRIQT